MAERGEREPCLGVYEPTLTPDKLAKLAALETTRNPGPFDGDPHHFRLAV
jgi:hypothetical protein